MDTITSTFWFRKLIALGAWAWLDLDVFNWQASNSDSIGLSSSTTCEEEHTPSTSGSGSLVFQQDEKPDVKGISVTVAGNIQIKKEGKLDGLLKYELTDKQKADIKEAFDTLDYDKTGFIYTKDLKVWQWHQHHILYTTTKRWWINRDCLNGMIWFWLHSF